MGSGLRVEGLRVLMGLEFWRRRCGSGLAGVRALC